jgi:hypothetical protein
MPKLFLHTEATLGNVTIDTNTNSSEADHIADCDVIFSKSSARLRERLKLAFIRAPDTSIVFPVMNIYRPTLRESWAL